MEQGSAYKDAEMHHRICKKMAQLTRVIHNMNTRNVQNAVLLKDVVRDYEAEVDRVVADCNGLLAKAKAVAEKNARQDELKDKLKKVEADLDAEKKKARKEFEALKAKVEDREKKGNSELEVSLLLQGQNVGAKAKL
jgi:predicted proteasome-type protease